MSTSTGSGQAARRSPAVAGEGIIASFPRAVSTIVTLRDGSRADIMAPINGWEEPMSEAKVYAVPDEWQKTAYVDATRYQEMYQASIANPDAFWGEHAKRIDWIKPFTKVKNTSFAPDNVSIKWFEDGSLNVCANCVDRHVETRGDQVALIWEGDEPDMDLKIT
jgi:hypothetical protein